MKLKSSLAWAAVGLLLVGGGCSNSADTTLDTSLNTATSQAEWVSYTPTNGSFTAEFPMQPEYTTEPIAIPDSELTFIADTYSAETSDAFYSLAVFTYPESLDLSDTDARLQGALDGMVASTGGTVVEGEFSTFQDFPSLNYTLQTADGIQLKGIAAVVDHTVYQLMYVSNTSGFNSSDYQQYLDSFQIN